MSGGNNPTYTHWKPNVSLDLVTSTGSSNVNYTGVLKMSGSSMAGPHPSISMATLTAIPSHADHLNAVAQSLSHTALTGTPPAAHLFSPVAAIQRHHAQQISPQQQNEMVGPHSPSLPHHQIDLYSPISMQRLGQKYKSNLILNNNNNSTHHIKHIDMSTIKNDANISNIQHLVENSIRYAASPARCFPHFHCIGSVLMFLVFFLHLSGDAKQQIMQILEKISLLQPPERLLLYLRMPSNTSETGEFAVKYCTCSEIALSSIERFFCRPIATTPKPSRHPVRN